LLRLNAPIRTLPYPSFSYTPPSLQYTNTLGQSLLSSRWNLNLAAKFCHLFDSSVENITCPVCHSVLDSHITGILVLLLQTRPEWQKDMLKEMGLGKYSFLEFQALEKKVIELMNNGRLEDAEAVLKVVETFVDWEAKAAVLRKKLERGIHAAGGAKKVENSGTGWYRVVRLAEGGVGVLVRT
jgi:hypothetical protein